ncbi:MAG: hypothetical protein AAFY51_09760 [Pseudomonadota bacterium]
MLFRFLALGENFPMAGEDGMRMMGWYKTAWVKASNLEEAKTQALDMVGKELRENRLETTSESSVSWDEIEEFENGEIPEPASGFTFFEMEI